MTHDAFDKLHRLVEPYDHGQPLKPIPGVDYDVDTPVDTPLTDVDTYEDNAIEDGGSFVFDGAVDLVARWGSGHDVLWASGESMLIAAPTGVGKTTVAVQLVEALCGVGSGHVLGYPVLPAKRVLYLAMDRPRQIKRAMRRLFGPEARQTLDKYLVVRRGPLPTDLAKAPDQILLIAQKVGADVVIVDSLKDTCAKLTDDESGSMVNRAIQLCNAENVDVCVLHHQRKGEQGQPPKTLTDVYGSTWITAGCGSVIVLWGDAGSEQIELLHLKQPADPVGPLKLEHDHQTGRTVITEGFDALAWLKRQGPSGGTVTAAAKAEHGKDVKPGGAQWKRTERRLRGLVRDGFATKDEQAIVGAEVRYRYDTESHAASMTPPLCAVDTSRGHAKVTASVDAYVDADDDPI